MMETRINAMIADRVHTVIIAFLVCLSTGTELAASTLSGGEKVGFVYDVGFSFRFDNREYDRSGFSSSGTLFGARLTPLAGLSINQKDGQEHRLMLGIDIMKEFGASPVPEFVSGAGDAGETDPALNNWSLFRELIFYYSWKRTAGRTHFTLNAGIIPRKMMTGRYSTAFFSDEFRFYDSNVEGLLLSFVRPSSSFELGCDWMGMFGNARRERFMIFSSGEGRVSDFFSLGYSGYLYHFAGAENVRGVVDNILLNPYVGFDISRYAGIQKFFVRAGWLQSLQNDRIGGKGYVFPGGPELDAGIGHWNAGLENRLFYGSNMMPYYFTEDAAGVRYGNLLYFGDPFYRITEDGAGHGFYDRLELFYEPEISDLLTLKISAILHFNRGFSGWQQMVSLKFNLDSSMWKKKRR